MATTKVAVLDGEFDLNHASGKLNFSFPRSNQTDQTDQVGVVNDHAHGTLWAGLICAEPGIPDWPEGGLAPGVTMIPVSVYRTVEPVRAELEHLVDGISFAVHNGCDVISISLSGFPPASSLLGAVEAAQHADAVIVAGTGNRRVDESGDPGRVGYPAKFGTVIGVGAATVTGPDGDRSLARVTIGSSDDAGADPSWESRYGLGIDVVAQGLGVTSTDISNGGGANRVPSPEGDVWDGFSGTSAATPIVAGLAAKIIASGDHSGPSIRRKIRLAAEKIGPLAYNREYNGISWNRHLGYGWIGRGTVEQWDEATGSIGASGIEGSDGMSDTTESNVLCMADELIEDSVGVEGYEYARMFSDAVRPLADFLAALGSTDGPCCTMSAHFWQRPYKTARIAGLPWQAAVLLGRGDWEAVYSAVNTEYEHIPDSQRPPGPIWVRAT